MQDALFNRLSEFLSSRIGLYFPMERRADLERGMISAAGELGFPGEDAWARWLLSGKAERSQMEKLASHLAIGETYFFRDRKVFHALEQDVLPELLRKKSTLRIWSAGCSTGEEPYSIAMLLDRLAPDREDIQIFATDINPFSLEKAAKGLYGEWSFRDAPGWIKGTCFKEKGDVFELLPRIRKMVSYSVLNLAQDPYPEGMDIIFCRNVLMYFSPEKREMAAAGFYRAMSEYGWLVVSPAEVSDRLFSRFERADFPDAMLYRKVPEMQQAVPILEDKPRRAANPVPVAVAEEPDCDVCVMAKQCADRGNLDEAEKWCEKAVSADPLDPQKHYLHATILHEMKRFNEEEGALRRTVYLDPDFVLAHFALGNLCLSQWRGKEAVHHFENALNLLENLPRDEILPKSDGLAAGRLAEIVATLHRRTAHEGR